MDIDMKSSIKYLLGIAAIAVVSGIALVSLTGCGDVSITTTSGADSTPVEPVIVTPVVIQ